MKRTAVGAVLLRGQRPLVGYKVMRLRGRRLVSGKDLRLTFPAKVGTILKAPGTNGIYLSPNREYVLTYYRGHDREALLTLSFLESDVISGNLTDREAEVSVREAEVVDLEELEVE